MIDELFYNFKLFFGNWIVIAGVGSLYFMLLKTFSKPNYQKLWNTFEFTMRYQIIAVLGLSVIMIREMALYSWDLIASWMPGSYAWEILVLYLGTTHLPSILFGAALIFYLWKKWNNFVPAVIMGLQIRL